MLSCLQRPDSAKQPIFSKAALKEAAQINALKIAWHWDEGPQGWIEQHSPTPRGCEHRSEPQSKATLSIFAGLVLSAHGFLSGLEEKSWKLQWELLPISIFSIFFFLSQNCVQIRTLKQESEQFSTGVTCAQAEILFSIWTKKSIQVHNFLYLRRWLKNTHGYLQLACSYALIR